MSNEVLFEINYGGRFTRAGQTEYVGGQNKVHHEPWDMDCLSFFEVEGILVEYGYMPGDLMYYQQPNKTLEEGLVLISSDQDILDMVGCHIGHTVIVIYTVTYEGENNKNASEKKKGTAGKGKNVMVEQEEEESSSDSYPFWAVVVSGEEDVFEGEGNHETSAYRPLIVTEEPEIEGDKDADMGSDIADSQELLSCTEDLEDVEKANKDNTGKYSSRGDTKFPEFRLTEMVNPRLEKGMKFATVEVFREAIREANILIGKDLHWAKNDRDKVIVKCKGKKCEYRVYGRKVKEELTFQIISLMGMHKCTRSFKNNQVSSKWIANKYMEQFKHNPTWLVSALMHDIKRSWKVDVSRCKLYRAKTMAKRNIFGMHKDQYARLWDYCATLRRTNPRSCIFMNVARPRPDRQGTFRRLYVSLAAMRDGFRAGCRPLIGLDGCFLKGPFKGQMLCAVGRDGNENIYPVAFAAVEAETKESWSWFLDILVSDLGPCHPNGWTFISDRQKGLIPSFAEVLPNTDHRICVRHLYANFRDEGHRGQLLKDRLWAAASAYTKYEFEAEMLTLKALDEKAHKYLADIDPALWARSHFSTHSRSDLLVNNLSECFNSYILDARDKPIISMMEAIRKKLMRRYQMKREGMSKMDEKLCPTIMRKLDRNGLESCDCVSTYAGDGLFEVDHKMKQYVVNLKERTCGCRRWDLTGIPCAHGISAILYSGEKPEDYVDDFYSMETYMKAYEPIIRPMPSVDQWERTPNEPVLPPIARVRPGRPKKVRRRAADEPKNSNRISKIGTKIKCSKCGKIGHNSRTCKKKGAITTPPATFGDVPISQSNSTTLFDSMISYTAPTNHENSSQEVVGITLPPSWGRTNSTPTQAPIEQTGSAAGVIEKRKGKCHVVPTVEKRIEVMHAKKKKQKY